MREIIVVSSYSSSRYIEDRGFPACHKGQLNNKHRQCFGEETEALLVILCTKLHFTLYSQRATARKENRSACFMPPISFTCRLQDSCLVQLCNHHHSSSRKHHLGNSGWGRGGQRTAYRYKLRNQSRSRLHAAVLDRGMGNHSTESKYRQPRIQHVAKTRIQLGRSHHHAK